MKTISFPFSIDYRGRVAMSGSASKTWTDRVRAVISTQPGERVLRGEFGTPVNLALMDYESGLVDTLDEAIRASFNQYLPDLDIAELRTDFDDENGVLSVEILFNLPDGTQVSTQVSLDGGTIFYEESNYIQEA